ncbi:MAG: hypothetical protein JXB62_15970 [Pirellulales bacterium]|nr:hypothetical protein [Pirellulales bacterium]
MITFQRTPRPRNYLSRREQWRLLLLMMSLGLVVILMSEAHKPANWNWLFAQGDAPTGRRADAGADEGTEIDNRLPDSPPDSTALPPGHILSSAPDRADPSAADTPGPSGDTGLFPGVEPKYLKSIRDDTTFRYDERHAWFNLLDVLRRTDESALREASLGRVTFAQLFNQPNEYRGELVTIRGTVRRAHPLEAPKNDKQIDRYCQTWVQPADHQTTPMVVYCLSLPKGFPTGMDVSAKVEVTGFFFKRWAYRAQDGLRTTPVLLARTVHWEDGSTATEPIGEPIGDADLTAKPSAMPAEPRADEPPKQQIAGPRELLQLRGIDESHLALLVDGRPVDDSETEILLNVLYWLGRCPTSDIERWARPMPKPAELVDSTEANRGEIFRLAGRIAKVAPCRPLPEVVERLELQEYYRCELLLAEQQQPAVVFALGVPDAWRRGGAVAGRAGAFGLYLKSAADDPRRPVPVFVAQRVAWYPDTLLGRLGMDVGLLDEVEDRRDLIDVDREAFYQMLDAVGRAEPGQLHRAAEAQRQQTGKDRDSVVPLFTSAERQRGKLVELSGTARRVVLIRVKDPDVVERFGIDHYYEIALFTDDSQDNPLFFCVRELPEGMPTGDGPEYGEHVRIAGFYFKLWRYRTSREDPERGTALGQLAPLLVGSRPRWYPQESPVANTTIQAIAGGLFVVVLVGIWLALWRFGRGDRRFHDQTLVKAHGPEAGIALDEIQLQADGTPDFAAIERMDRGEAQQDSPPTP